MIKKTITGLVLLGAFASGYATADVSRVSSRAYEQGITEMTWSVAGCTLEVAHTEKCFIPCSTDLDCVEKNGQ